MRWPSCMHANQAALGALLFSLGILTWVGQRRHSATCKIRVLCLYPMHVNQCDYFVICAALIYSLSYIFQARQAQGREGNYRMQEPHSSSLVTMLLTPREKPGEWL